MTSSYKLQYNVLSTESPPVSTLQRSGQTWVRRVKTESTNGSGRVGPGVYGTCIGRVSRVELGKVSGSTLISSLATHRVCVAGVSPSGDKASVLRLNLNRACFSSRRGSLTGPKLQHLRHLQHNDVIGAPCFEGNAAGLS